VSGAPWYAAGLRFSCRRCGACCTGAPGHVWLAHGEADALAALLGLPVDAFLASCARRVYGLWSLLEKEDGCCVFFVPGSGCSVYAARPRQCRSWPFWPRIVAARRNWEEEAASCPGMGSGELFDRERIEELVRDPARAPRGGR
jgi:hypothetical protein